ncbi:Uncharacterized conserved protein [Phaffia rhodozyma]|uniref:Uncharacterized conserved protein n=1 Tax=Phaffia rhodozyma TaxID=264483 RepID=A0A0F7SNN2_PHARH|nr:Uncharacterized conserved protein [Phaffia rhodozyma]
MNTAQMNLEEPPLERDLAMVVAIAARVAAPKQNGPDPWATSVCDHLQLNPAVLPDSPSISDIEAMRPIVTPSTHARVLRALVYSSIFSLHRNKDTDSKGFSLLTKGSPPPPIEYTSISRAAIYRTADVLNIPSTGIIPEETVVAAELFKMLQAISSDKAQSELEEHQRVEKARKEREEGWGGKWGRWAATGAGVVIGSVALGITGGVAAPAILALLPTIGLLTPATAPVVLGTFFGLTGGGLAGRRVRNRWSGVKQFEFVQIDDKIDPLGRPKPNHYREQEANRVEVPYAVRKKTSPNSGTKPPLLEPKLEALSVSEEVDEVNKAREEKEERNTTIEIPSKAPSLSVVIVVPGLLTEDELEGVRTWRSISETSKKGPISVIQAASSSPSSEKTSMDGMVHPVPDDVETKGQPNQVLEEIELRKIAFDYEDEKVLMFRGRDIFLAKIETEIMLSTGKEINQWITTKLISKAGREIIKRTFVNAYLSAVALPLTVYGWAGTALDNSWMRAVDKSKKAGQVLADVLISKVQGSRPVVLVGTSLGALTVFYCLLALASSDSPEALSIVDSAYLISLPSSPSEVQWKKARSVVGRRVVNGWSGRDIVLSGVVRLHEVVGKVGEGRVDGASVAGLCKVEIEGIENVDLSAVVDGHFSINRPRTLAEILRLIDTDA